MIRIFIDRQSIAENTPAIVVERHGQAAVHCSEVRTPQFVVKQDFTGLKKPTVWIEALTDVEMVTTKPRKARK